VVRRQEFRQICKTRFLQDRQITAIDHALLQRARPRYQFSKKRVQFRRAAGNIDGFDRARIEKLKHHLQGLARHLFLAFGACVDMAVEAGLIALVPDIDLQSIRPGTMNSGKIGFF
jgi:hypothetical protein